MYLLLTEGADAFVPGPLGSHPRAAVLALDGFGLNFFFAVGAFPRLLRLAHCGCLRIAV